MLIGNLFTHWIICFTNNYFMRIEQIQLTWIRAFQWKNEFKQTLAILSYYLNEFNNLQSVLYPIIALRSLFITSNILALYLEYIYNIVLCNSVIHSGSLSRIMFWLGNHKKSTICISDKRTLWLVKFHNIKIFYNQVWIEYIT